MKIWILLAIAVLLLVWGIRERFEATQSIKAPPYDDAEKKRIFDMLNNVDQRELIRQAKEQDPTLEANVTKARDAYNAAAAADKDAAKTAWDKAKDAIPKKAADIIADPVAKFFTEKYKPATVPITNADVKKYVEDLQDPRNKKMIEQILRRYFVGQSGIGTSVASGYAAALKELGQDAGYLAPNAPAGAAAGATPPVPAGGAGGATASATSSTPATAGASGDTIDPTCPTGTVLNNQGMCSARPVREVVPPTGCPTGYTQTPVGGCKGPGGPMDFKPPLCPSGKVIGNDGCIDPETPPSCPIGYALSNQPPAGWKCRRFGGGMASSSTAPAGSGGVATTTGNTTGGSSTSSPGPTSGGGGRFGIWGPVSGGRGEGGNGPVGNSTTTTQYPQLLGGMNAGGDRTRIDGIGLTEPSQNWKLSMSGMLPTMDSLGAGDLSKYLPWSRTPGDMDKIPDPYRVSQTFSTSSYSSKTEPVPFLADFSAFQR